MLFDLLPGEFPFRPMCAVAIGLVTVSRPIVHLITAVATHRFFKNVLMDTLKYPYITPILLHSPLLKFSQYFIINYTFTSQQGVHWFGVHISLCHQPPGPSLTMHCTVVNQGTYAVRLPVVNSEPQWQLNICKISRKNEDKYLEDESYLHHRYVARFMLRADIKGYSVMGKVYAYCQVCDVFIDKG